MQKTSQFESQQTDQQEPNDNDQSDDLRRNSNQSAQATERVAAAVHARVDDIARVSAAAEESIRETAQEASANAEGKAKSVLSDTTEVIKANPLAAAGVAFAVGFLASTILRR